MKNKNQLVRKKNYEFMLLSLVSLSSIYSQNVFATKAKRTWLEWIKSPFQSAPKEVEVKQNCNPEEVHKPDEAAEKTVNTADDKQHSAQTIEARKEEIITLLQHLYKVETHALNDELKSKEGFKKNLQAFNDNSEVKKLRSKITDANHIEGMKEFAEDANNLLELFEKHIKAEVAVETNEESIENYKRAYRADKRAKAKARTEFKFAKLIVESKMPFKRDFLKRLGWFDNDKFTNQVYNKFQAKGELQSQTDNKRARKRNLESATNKRLELFQESQNSHKEIYSHSLIQNWSKEEYIKKIEKKRLPEIAQELTSINEALDDAFDAQGVTYVHQATQNVRDKKKQKLFKTYFERYVEHSIKTSFIDEILNKEGAFVNLKQPKDIKDTDLKKFMDKAFRDARNDVANKIVDKISQHAQALWSGAEGKKGLEDMTQPDEKTEVYIKTYASFLRNLLEKGHKIGRSDGIATFEKAKEYIGNFVNQKEPLYNEDKTSKTETRERVLEKMKLTSVINSVDKSVLKKKLKILQEEAQRDFERYKIQSIKDDTVPGQDGKGSRNLVAVDSQQAGGKPQFAAPALKAIDTASSIGSTISANTSVPHSGASTLNLESALSAPSSVSVTPSNILAAPAAQLGPVAVVAAAPTEEGAASAAAQVAPAPAQTAATSQLAASQVSPSLSTSQNGNGTHVGAGIITASSNPATATLQASSPGKKEKKWWQRHITSFIPKKIKTKIKTFFTRKKQSNQNSESTTTAQ